jgi:hypothetical protein
MARTEDRMAWRGRAPATMTRRGTLGLGLGLMALPWRAAWAGGPHDLVFEIIRKGEPIGRHGVRFLGDGDALEVVSEIDVTVRLAFITVFSFEQEARDRWQGRTLIGSTVTTDENGQRTRMSLEAKAGRLRGEGARGALDLPLGLFTDLSWWNRSIVEQDALIDAQTGEVAPVDLRTGRAGSVEIAGQPVAAQGFELASTKGRGGTIWYDMDGNWIAATMHTRGETLEYRLIA